MMIFSVNAGGRGGKVVAYKPQLDEAIRLAAHKPEHVLLVDRGLAPMARAPGRDVDYARLREHTARTRRVLSPSWARCRRAACKRCGATTTASSKPTGPAFPVSRCIRPSTGACATRTAISSSWAAPTT